MEDIKKYKLTTSKYAEAVLRFKNKPLRLVDYEPFKEIYDCDPPVLVLKAGRQVGKSLSLAGVLSCKSTLRPYFNTLYVAPLRQQTAKFSTQYVAPFLGSPILKKHFMDSTTTKNVFQKSFNNGSTIFLTYAETEQDADRIRGINADTLLIDEVQDVSYEALPVIKETLGASPFAFEMYTGTANGDNNTLELLFNGTNMLEWCVKCSGCGKWSIPNTLVNCMNMCKLPTGPCCMHCSKPIDVRTGKWVAAKPSIKDRFGFHLPQLIFSARTGPKKWGEILGKIDGPERYTPTKLSNEVFGLSAGAGNRILTISECRKVCHEPEDAWNKVSIGDKSILRTVLGVDWSVTGGVASFTVLTVIGTDFLGKTYVLFSERLNSVDILKQVDRVMQVFFMFKCDIISSDRGVGVVQVQTLQRDLGNDRVFPIQYVASKTKLRWDTTGGFFAADRTMAIDSTIMKIKAGINRFQTPSWSIMKTFFDDILAIYEEESTSGRMGGRKLYRKDADKPDDWGHSLTFALIGDMILRKDYVVTEPRETPFYT